MLDTTFIFDVVRGNSKVVPIVSTKVTARNIKLPKFKRTLFSLS